MAAAGGTPGAGRRAVYPRRGGIPFPICDGSGGGVAFLPGVSAGGGRPLGHCACVVGAGGLMLAAGVPPSPRPICDGGGCGGGSLPAACLWLWSAATEDDAVRSGGAGGGGSARHARSGGLRTCYRSFHEALLRGGGRGRRWGGAPVGVTATGRGGSGHRVVDGDGGCATPAVPCYCWLAPPGVTH